MKQHSAYILGRQAEVPAGADDAAAQLGRENALLAALARRSYSGRRRAASLQLLHAAALRRPRAAGLALALVLAGSAACGVATMPETSSRLAALFSRRAGWRSPQELRAQYDAVPNVSSPRNLALDEPNNSFSMAMVHAGAVDYYVQHGAAAPDIATLAAAGFLPYAVPAAAQLDYTVENGDTVRVRCLGSYVYTRGGHQGLLRVGQRFPVDGPFTTVILPGVNGAPGREVKAQTYACSQYLDQGYSIAELAPIQQRTRLVKRLLDAANEYIALHRTPPAGMAELEAFIGTPRNPVAWQGIRVVGRLDQVALAPGSLYAGWAAPQRFEIRVNLGPEVVGSAFEPYGGVYISVDGNLPASAP
jgi:hypothetical protein